ncbi:unnamed protein product [marine sediment metagenome]|uniref:Uncharacterized protein n=1 Tax=marine sediment metagenome TaxID=412755 RepID=X1H3L4_9ZZZZ
MKSLFLKQQLSIKSKLQWNSEGLDKISLRNKILNDINNLNMNDTVDFLKIFLKNNKFYSTKSFIRFLLKESDLLNYYRDYDDKMLNKLRLIKGNLIKERLIKPFNSQVFRVV